MLNTNRRNSWNGKEIFSPDIIRTTIFVGDVDRSKGLSGKISRNVD